MNTSNTISSTKSNASDDDQFDAFVSCAPVNKSDELVGLQQSDKNASSKTNEEEDFFNQKAPEQKKLDKESILKLYESSNLNQGQNNLFNVASSNTLLQPMNVATNTLVNGFNTAGLVNGLANQQTQLANNLFNSPNSNTNVINNGFANFNSQPVNQQPNQQPFLAFNQPATAAVQSTINLPSTNPFLTTPATNGTSTLTTNNLFPSNVNTNLSTTLESQLNGLNLNTASNTAINWPNSATTTSSNGLSVGQSLFSANFDILNEKKLGDLSSTATNSTPPTNPFLNSSSTVPLQPSTNLDILSSFNTQTTTTASTTNGLNGLNNDLEGWSSFHHTASAATNSNGLIADIGWP